MKTVNIYFSGFEELEKTVTDNSFLDSKNLLIQIFDGRNSYTDFCILSEYIAKLLPTATVLGVSTAGEILNAKMSENGAVISFCSFKNTTLIPLSSQGSEYKDGVLSANAIDGDDIKAAIFFSDGLYSNADEFLNGLKSVKKGIVIAGGAAADNGLFKETFVSLNGVVNQKWIIGVAFKNKDLGVINDWELGYNPIGKEMKITKAAGAELFELDGKPIFEIVKKYFGEKILNTLPASIVKFPLLKKTQNVSVARAPVAKTENSLIFAGSFDEGEIVRFAIADMKNIGSKEPPNGIRKAQGIWIYSCMGRKAFAGKLLEKEFEKYTPVSSAGFFGYGEFYDASKTTSKLNLTTTLFALYEDDLDTSKHHNIEHPDDTQSDIETVAYLANAVVADLEEALSDINTYKIALDSNSIVSKTDKRGIITYVNDLFIKVSGYTKEELIGKSHSIIRHPDMPDSLFIELWKTVSSGKTWKGIVKNRRKDGGEYFVDTAIVPLLDQDGNIKEYIAARTDITTLVKQQQTIERQALDHLTGLPNRVKFFEDDATIGGYRSIAILNIDGFGTINRFYGFENGNSILIAISKSISEFTAKNGFYPYKLDADSFLVASETMESDDFVEAINGFIKDVKQKPFLAGTFEVNVRLSAGVASSSGLLLSKAEEALKKARIKRVDVAILNDEDERAKQQNFEMLKILEYAINNDSIEPYYQAIVDIRTKQTVKYESLMRIKDQDGKIYSPYPFLEVAKKSKYYPAMTRTVVKKTLVDFAARDEEVSLNISVYDIENEDTVSMIKKSLMEFPEPKRVIFELTESETLEDYAKITEFIEEIKKLGAKISIDDFGSGYSNFAYLAKFNADFLKIDGSIIKNIASDRLYYQIADSIKDFAKKLGIKTVAEFVSNEEIAKKAEELGIDYGQGFLYAVPKPICEL